MEIIRKIIHNTILILALVTLYSCQNNIVFEQTKDIHSSVWHKDSLVNLTFQPKDTLQTYDIFFLVRNDNTYPYANIFLIATIENKYYKIIDTLEYEMADAQGNWLGSGISDLKESKLVYKKKYRFKDTLPVNFQIQHAVRKTGQTMGDEELPGIKTIGIVIEKHKD